MKYHKYHLQRMIENFFLYQKDIISKVYVASDEGAVTHPTNCSVYLTIAKGYVIPEPKSWRKLCDLVKNRFSEHNFKFYQESRNGIELIC